MRASSVVQHALPDRLMSGCSMTSLKTVSYTHLDVYKRQQNDQHEITSYKTLLDIIGSEDFYGDMDFKLCGTSEGVTGYQLSLIHIWYTACRMKRRPGMWLFVYGSRFAGMKAPAAGRAGGWRKGVRC